jgi:DNA mismatch endonuclease, patch repair protein
MATRTPSKLLGVPYPEPTSPAVTAQMRGNKRADTKPEIAVRSALHRRGYRFRKDCPIRAGAVLVRPDIVFTRQRIAVFIDGCFWHRCPDHGNQPRTNTEYWRRKLDRNVERDIRVVSGLTAAGWKCLRIWEHTPVDEAVALVTTEHAARSS